MIRNFLCWKEILGKNFHCTVIPNCSDKTFANLEPIQHCRAIGQSLLGEQYVTRKKKKKKNNSKNSGHYVPLQRPRAVHALRLDQYLSSWVWSYPGRDYNRLLSTLIGVETDLLFSYRGLFWVFWQTKTQLVVKPS